MPFANQGGAVAHAFQQRRQCGVCGRQAQGGAGARFAVDGLLSGAAQAVLVARGHEAKSCGRANRGIGVPVSELQTIGRKRVNNGRDFAKLSVPPAVAAQVGKA